ncbi:transmembrane protein 183-like [Wyeomyia smithii]|uniref:transmembrane protein 183-like n=1 Tax=Wyeomyia smithii TaxID=174621 RepID=UPI0024681683|nr:transmembrane protein 183-like [Wyeomyia smithii]XP_055548003.1 transmembrane protein 183-like [Wyeomyia smithii]
MAVCVKVKSRSLNSKSDISIYDYAHSKKSTTRVSKANKLSVDVTEEEHDSELGEDQIGLGLQNVVSNTPQENSYSDYVIAIWYLISEYILPEDVCSFALICRKTAEVVQSAKFWHHLYQKYCKQCDEDLPRRLQPVNMGILRGLRTCTIRSLFYMYPPFVRRLSIAPFTDPHRIAGRQLVFSWYRKNKTGWNYYFKLKARLIPGSRSAQSVALQGQRTSLDYLKDIYMNPEEGCQILIVTTETLHIIPQYQEPLFIRSLTQTLAEGMRNYMVRLQMANYCKRVVAEIILVPVRQVRVLDWWTPDYYREDPNMEKQDQPLVEEVDAWYWDD